jgi:hypothetical protein
MFSLSLESLEVDFVIAPLFVIFLLMLLPVPLLSRMLTRLVAAIESVQLLNMSILMLGSCLSFLFFLVTAYTNWNLSQVKPKAVEQRIVDEWNLKRRRGERNLYLHWLAFVLIAAVWKIARINAALAKIQREAKKIS